MADPWSAQPLLGIDGIYSSNPSQVTTQTHSVTTAAATLDMPINYDADEIHLALAPRVRYGNKETYASLTSNYFHLDASARYASEVNTLTADQSLYRDSSALYVGGLQNGVGLRRDTTTSDLNWQHAFTERALFLADVNTARVLFDQGANLHGLVDYRYTSLSPSLAYAINELDSLRIIAGIGRYYSLNSLTSSNTDSIQVGYVHRFSELWTLSATGGYSKSKDVSDFIFFGFYLGAIKETQDSPVYSATIGRTGEHLSVTFNASRSFAPTGFQFLERQDVLAVTANYTKNERWAYSVVANWEALTGPPSANGSSTTGHYFSASASATWHLTERWQSTFTVSRVEQTAAQADTSVATTGIVLQIARQFDRTNN